MAVTLYQKRTAARRRTADITRLAEEYKRGVQSLTSDYEKAFAGYQQQRAEKMAPYEQAVSNYQTAFATYEQQADAYRKRLESYQALLEDIRKNPNERVAAVPARIGRGGEPGALVDGQALSFATLQERGYEPEGEYSSGKGARLISIKSISVPRKAPDPFTETAPAAPTPPQAPEIAEFDTSEFSTRRGQLESGYRREIGERRAAKLAAVSRSSARPLMQGA